MHGVVDTRIRARSGQTGARFGRSKPEPAYSGCSAPAAARGSVFERPRARLRCRLRGRRPCRAPRLRAGRGRHATSRRCGPRSRTLRAALAGGGEPAAERELPDRGRREPRTAELRDALATGRPAPMVETGFGARGPRRSSGSPSSEAVRGPDAGGGRESAALIDAGPRRRPRAHRHQVEEAADRAASSRAEQTAAQLEAELVEREQQMVEAGWRPTGTTSRACRPTQPCAPPRCSARRPSAEAEEIRRRDRDGDRPARRHAGAGTAGPRPAQRRCAPGCVPCSNAWTGWCRPRPRPQRTAMAIGGRSPTRDPRLRDQSRPAEKVASVSALE